MYVVLQHKREKKGKKKLCRRQCSLVMVLHWMLSRQEQIFRDDILKKINGV